MLTLPDAIPLSTLILAVVAAVAGLAKGKSDRASTERRIPASAITAIYVNEAIAREVVDQLREIKDELRHLNDTAIKMSG